jgi:hypothetical protein
MDLTDHFAFAIIRLLLEHLCFNIEWAGVIARRRRLILAHEVGLQSFWNCV